MSGGLDSSVTAHLLAERGESVVGLSMLLWDQLAEGSSDEPAQGRCCGALDLGDARRVAQQIGIPHYTLRMDREFREKVVDPFVQDYLDGRTPSPCVRCNTWVKFDLLLERARSFGAATVATGHYARVVEGPHGYELHTALDQEKDQTYYLFELTQAQLAASRFPLGELDKRTVREIARRAGLIVAEKGESMEVCFVAGGVREFIERQVERDPARYRTQADSVPAEVVDKTGQPLGHVRDPYYRYTVGQRRGLGVAASGRLYVLGVEADRNRVVVGAESDLLAGGLRGERLHWINEPERLRATGEGVRARVRIRSRHPGIDSTIRTLPDGKAEVRFDEPQRGVAPGQAAVFYEGTRVLGGCWITRSLPA